MGNIRLVSLPALPKPSVESRVVVEEAPWISEGGLSPWFYSIPVIIAAVGIIFVHRKWAEFRRMPSDDDEFEWE